MSDSRMHGDDGLEGGRLVEREGVEEEQGAVELGGAETASGEEDDADDGVTGVDPDIAVEGDGAAPE